MLPVKPLIQKLQRVARDTAKAVDKQIVLDLEGDQLSVDKSVLDQLGDPLIHIVRNAIDHGVEAKDERQATTKSPEGHIGLKFQNEGNNLVIEVTDDGKGIDGQRLRKKAIERQVNF